MTSPVYVIGHEKIKKPLKTAVVSDLHGRKMGHVMKLLEKISPDLVLIPGDLCESLTAEESMDNYGLEALREICGVARVYYSLGNHELGRDFKSKGHWQEKPAGICEAARERIRQTGAVLLENEYVSAEGIVIGGMSSGLVNPDRTPSTEWLESFEKEDGFRLLLCHHPEYFPKFLLHREIDLSVAGHAHGGQWRIGNQGVYAPGQGLFPRYTRGVYGGRLLVSAGIGNQIPVPRLFNPGEIPMLFLTPKMPGNRFFEL